MTRTTQEATFDAAAASATIEQVAEPRTCDDGGGMLYFTDTIWSFEGVLVDHVPAPEPDDLAGYLASYGLECTEADAVSTCSLELTDDDGLDATYEVATRLDDSGATVAVDALVTSLDASMPSACEVTSMTTASADPPLPRIPATASSSRSARRAPSTTAAPAAARCCAIARPIPDDAPVIAAT